MCKDKQERSRLEPIDYKPGLPPGVIDEAIESIWFGEPVIYRLLVHQLEPYASALHEWERESQEEIEKHEDALLALVESKIDRDTSREISSHITDVRAATPETSLSLGFAVGLIVAGVPEATVKRLVCGMGKGEPQ